jgi:hypothetical protein
MMYSTVEIKQKRETGKTSRAVRSAVLDVHWGVWSLLIAATINFVMALAEGNIFNLLACLACLVGLFGIVHSIK